MSVNTEEEAKVAAELAKDELITPAAAKMIDAQNNRDEQSKRVGTLAFTAQLMPKVTVELRRGEASSRESELARDVTWLKRACNRHMDVRVTRNGVGGRTVGASNHHHEALKDKISELKGALDKDIMQWAVTKVC